MVFFNPSKTSDLFKISMLWGAQVFAEGMWTLEFNLNFDFFVSQKPSRIILVFLRELREIDDGEQMKTDINNNLIKVDIEKNVN